MVGTAFCRTLQVLAVVLLLAPFPSVIQAQEKEHLVERPTSYRTVLVDGLSIFYREAGSEKFAYTFDHIAETMIRFTEALRLSRYSLYMQDYGGPVGFA